jgi:hypothetical protein
VSKPLKSAPKFSLHQWGVTLEVAFARVETVVGGVRAQDEINEGLRTERLKSREWQISPDSERTWRRLNWSDWAHRRVRIQRAILAPRPGGFGLAPRNETYIEGPQFTGLVFICLADLDEYYPTAAPPTMTAASHSDNTELSPPTTPAPEKQKPGVKPRQDWPNRLLAPEIVRVAYETPDLLRNRPELVRHVRNFLDDQIGWEPFDNKPINRELDRLLSRIIK